MKEPELIPFTFSNGVEAWLRKVPPLLLNKLKQANKPPKPPLEEVDMGNGPVWQPNPQAASHLQAMDEYNETIGMKIVEFLVQRGVKLKDAINLDELNEIRAVMREEGATLPADDHVAYILYVCVGDEQELSALRDAILRRTIPTEEAIAEKVATF